MKPKSPADLVSLAILALFYALGAAVVGYLEWMA